MRPSISRSRRLYRACEATSRRTYTSATRTLQPSICLLCSRNALFQPSNGTTRHFSSQTSKQSQTVEESTAPKQAPKTHYEFFPQTLSSGPPPSGPFDIDLRALRREFLQLQAVAHPDLHPASLKTRAEATSARINEAYKTLQSPLLRAQYLLSLRGIDVAEDESAKVKDSELLMDVLDAREAIESAETEGQVQELRRVNEERIGETEGVLGRAFGEDDLGRVKEEAIRLRYWINIRESLDAWENGKPVVLVH